MRSIMCFAALTLAVIVPCVASAQDENPRDLAGKEAPAVKLDLLKDGQLDLSSHKGKEYVVLDFTTTWCPWCVKSTQHIEERAKQYKDKPVAFYMIHFGEEKETVEKFIKKKGISVPVALDPDRAVADDYLVDYIPQVVVVDKEGKIVSVAIGEDEVGPAIDEALAKAFGEEKPETN
ncbi:MAG: hypothetical protein RLZZ303_469 [Candidatus Hydrogenedentota bacterium]